MSTPFIIANVRRPGEVEPVDIHIRGTRIESIWPSGAPAPLGARRIDGKGLIASPGFIDLHVHGGRGADFMDATEEAFDTIGAYHASGGTTAYLATTAAEDPSDILRCIDMAARCRDQRIGGVQILGTHVEGPYMAPTKHGCHHRAQVRMPTAAENKSYLDRAETIRRMTFAPELPGAIEFTRELQQAAVVASGGHSEATL